MAEKQIPRKNVKVEMRSTSNVLKIVLIALLVFSMAALIALRWVHNGIQAQTEALKDEAAAVENANTDLEDKIGALGSVQSVQDIAQEELGLVDPNTILIHPES